MLRHKKLLKTILAPAAGRPETYWQPARARTAPKIGRPAQPARRRQGRSRGATLGVATAPAREGGRSPGSLSLCDEELINPATVEIHDLEGPPLSFEGRAELGDPSGLEERKTVQGRVAVRGQVMEPENACGGQFSEWNKSATVSELDGRVGEVRSWPRRVNDARVELSEVLPCRDDGEPAGAALDHAAALRDVVRINPLQRDPAWRAGHVTGADRRHLGRGHLDQRRGRAGRGSLGDEDAVAAARFHPAEDRFEAFLAVQNRGPGTIPGHQRASGNHTNELVPLWAIGPAASSSPSSPAAISGPPTSGARSMAGTGRSSTTRPSSTS
jgi:hypothetical protein